MIDNETRRKLRELSHDEVIDIIDAQEKDPATLLLSFDERIMRITDYLYSQKNTSKIKRLIRLARFRIPNASLYDIVYEGRGFTRDIINSLRTCSFIKNNTNIICQGFTGSGKTSLSCAIGKEACENFYRTCYIRMPDLMMKYDEAGISGLKAKERILNKYAKYDLLILDEWLMNELSIEEEHFLFELIERRYDCRSTIFCTQYRQKDWLKRLGSTTHAEAIADRIVHNAIWIETGERNMREHRYPPTI